MMKPSRLIQIRGLLRIVDANYNRAKEAMRVAEDIHRYIRNDPRETKRWKKCRHDLTKILLAFPLPYREIIQARDTIRDVGRKSFISDRGSKTTSRDVLTANMKRSQEALRVLEEMSKVISPKSSHAFQRIRFRLYELEKASFSKF